MTGDQRFYNRVRSDNLYKQNKIEASKENFSETAIFATSGKEKMEKLWISGIFIFVTGAIFFLGLEIYNLNGLKAARLECKKAGVINIIDKDLWDRAIVLPREGKIVVTDFGSRHGDLRFKSTKRTLYIEGKPAAELETTTYSHISLINLIGISGKTDDFSCAHDMRRKEFSDAVKIFYD